MNSLIKLSKVMSVPLAELVKCRLSNIGLKKYGIVSILLKGKMAGMSARSAVLRIRILYR